MERMTLKAWHEESLTDPELGGDEYKDRDREVCAHEQAVASKAGLDVEKDIIEAPAMEGEDDLRHIKDHTWVLWMHGGWDDPIYILYHNKVPVAGWYTSCRGSMYIFEGYVKSEDKAYRATGVELKETTKDRCIPLDFINDLDPDNPYLLRRA